MKGPGKKLTPVILSIWAIQICAHVTTGYITGGPGIPPPSIQSVNLTNGALTPVVTTPGVGYAGLALANPTTLYATQTNTGLLTQINISNKALVPIGPAAGGPGIFGIALTNTNTAYAVNAIGVTGSLYSVDVTTGNSSVIATIADTPHLTGIALNYSLTNPITAYIVGTGTSNIYAVNLANGSITTAATVPLGATLEDIKLRNNDTALVTDIGNGIVWSVDLTTGLSTALATFSTAPAGIQLASNSIAYVGSTSNGTSDGIIYLLNLDTGNFSEIASSPADYISNIALVWNFDSTGNNAIVGNYLANNLSYYSLGALIVQPNINTALQSVNPLRNAIPTFVSQTTQLSLGQLVWDHLGRNRIDQIKKHRIQIESDQSITPPFTFASNDLLSSLSASFQEDQIAMNRMNGPYQTSPACPLEQANESFFSPWLGILGEYSREKEQDQTPAFEVGTGGALVGFDYYQKNCRTLFTAGGGGGYAYNHIHVADGAGKASVQQGSLLVYGEVHFLDRPCQLDWYLDLALSGGYYHTDNHREISLVGIPSVTATSTTYGWQIAPHFEAGFDRTFNHCNLTFTLEPFGMLDWVNNWEKGFRESGAAVLNMGQNRRTGSLLRTESGLRFYSTFIYCWGNVVFLQKGSYVYKKTLGNTGEITAFLLGHSNTFTVTTLSKAQNLGVVAFETQFLPTHTKYPYASLSYQGEFGSRYQSHIGMVEVGKLF